MEGEPSAASGATLEMRYSVKERNQEDDISFLEEDMSDAAMEMLDLL